MTVLEVLVILAPLAGLLAGLVLAPLVAVGTFLLLERAFGPVR